MDAVHRGFVRTRTPIHLGKANTTTQKDFTLNRGVSISGKLVDEQGKEWEIGESYGYAYTNPNRTQFELNEGDFSLTNFRSKYRPMSVEEGSPGTFLLGEGDYDCDQAVFPTASTFIIQGMMPGHTMIGLSPNKEKQRVVKILYNGRDILKSGIDTKPGQEIKDVTIVIGPDRKETPPAAKWPRHRQHVSRQPRPLGLARIAHGRVGRGRASSWWGCETDQPCINVLSHSKPSCRDRSPTRTSVCLTHPTIR